MQPGPVAMESETGDSWQCRLDSYTSKSGVGSRHRLWNGWQAVVAALQLVASQTVSLTALSPSRLLISREGETHFRAAARQALLHPKSTEAVALPHFPPASQRTSQRPLPLNREPEQVRERDVLDPWPLKILLTESSAVLRILPISRAAGRSIAFGSVHCVPAVIIPSPALTEGEADSNDWSRYLMLACIIISILQAIECVLMKITIRSLASDTCHPRSPHTS